MAIAAELADQLAGCHLTTQPSRRSFRMMVQIPVCSCTLSIRDRFAIPNHRRTAARTLTATFFLWRIVYIGLRRAHKTAITFHILLICWCNSVRYLYTH
uniref:Uncharacterized protein n=1 Tax=Rhipicephalus zambeziensis TaxID=60191 RepID=A0A224YG10_9ACAR